VYTDWEDVDAAGQPLVWPWKHHMVDGNILTDLFVEGCFICSSSALIRGEALARRGLRFRDRDFSFGDDYFLWLAVSLDWRAACIRDRLVRYRRHARNESARRPDVNFHLRRIELLREFLATFPDAEHKVSRASRAGFSRHYLRAARFECRRRRFGKGLACVARAFAASPATPIRAIARELAGSYRPPK
jgi:hypothetical protein